MQVREVTLHEGPRDGSFSIASHDTAIQQGEVYVHDGGDDPNRFVHANSALSRLSDAEWQGELTRVDAWMKEPWREGKLVPAPDLPKWRLNAWFQLLRYEALEPR